MKHKIVILLSVVFLFLTNVYGQDTISNDTTEWIPLKDGEYKHYYKRIGDRIYPATDDCIDYRYFKDVDIETFKVHKTARYAKDKNNVYYNISFCCEGAEDCVDMGDDDFEGPIIPNVNPNSFLVLEKGNYGDYGTDGINIYIGGFVIKGADVNSFKILKKYYSADKNTVFFFNKVVNGADRKSFRVFDYDEYSPYEYCAADKNNLYKRGVKFTDANPKKVRFLEGFIADDKNVYDNNGFLIKGRDGKTFQVLNQNKHYYYTKDKNGGYDVNGKIEGSDGKTFQYLGENYSKDKNNVYYYSTKIEGVDAKTFQVVSLCFTKDKNNVYYWLSPTEKRIIEKADPKTFQLLSEELAIKSDVYRYHAKDKNYVFYHFHIIEGANPKTFEYLKYPDGSYHSDKWVDKDFYYYIDNKTGQINKEKIAK